MATTASDPRLPFDPARYTLQRAVLRPLAAGTALVHSHRWDPVSGQFPFNAFNPRADTRFAGVLADPRRGGYYAGTTAECALAEADLRNVAGDARGSVAIAPEQVRHRRLSFVRTTRELQVLDLMPTPLSGMVADKAIAHAWTELTTLDAHGPTHAPAAALLAQCHGWGLQVDGFAWFSRQAGAADSHPVVYGFFAPPMDSPDFEEDPDRPSFDLDTAEGWAAIDRALAQRNLTRVPSGPAIGALLAPPDPGDEP